MRFAITTMAINGELRRDQALESSEEGEGRNILVDLRSLRACFEALNTSHGSEDSSFWKRDIEKKMKVMRTCVRKIENAAYDMIIRGRERSKG